MLGNRKETISEGVATEFLSYSAPSSYTYSFKAGGDITAYVYPMTDGTSGNEILFVGTGEMYDISVSNLTTSQGDVKWGCYAVNDDRGILRAIISNGITSVGDWLFCGMSKLKTVVLPRSITEIGEVAFGNCVQLGDIYIPDSVVKMNGTNRYHAGAFDGVGDSCTIHVKGKSSEPSTWASNNWLKGFNGTVEWEPYTYSFKAGENVTAYVYPINDKGENELIFVGSGPMYDDWGDFNNGTGDFPTWDSNHIQWGCSNHEDRGIVRAVISDGITSISHWTFAGLSVLEDVVLPTSITKIGNGAFAGCGLLRDITLPTNLVEIGSGAFQGCSSLKNIIIPSNVSRVDSCIFGSTSCNVHVKGKSSAPSTWASDWLGNEWVQFTGTLEWNCPH